MNKKDSPGFIVIMFIIFTFVGLGIFYIFTDYNSPFIDETNIYATKIYRKKDDSSLTYSSVFLKSNNKSIIELNNKKVSLSYSDNQKNLLFNDKSIISISKRKTYEMFNYNNLFLIIYEYYKKQNTGIIYIVDCDGNIVDYITNVDNKNKYMIPYSIYLDDDSLIIEAGRMENDRILILNDYYSSPSVCDEKALNQYSIIKDDVVSAKYSFNVDNNGKTSFKMIEVIETVGDYSNKYCR